MGFFDDVDFEKDLTALVIEESPEANLCCDECSKVCKTKRVLRDTKIQYTAPVEVIVCQVSSEEIIQKKLHPDVLLRVVQKSVSMTCVYLKRVEIFFEKILRVYIRRLSSTVTKIKIYCGRF